MRAWLVMLVIVLAAAGCDGGWRPHASGEANALWATSRSCDQPMWLASAPLPLGRAPTAMERLRVKPAPERLDDALREYAKTPGCGAACRARATAIVDSTSGPADCRAAAGLVRDTSLAGFDRDPDVKAMLSLWVRWFLSSYWLLVALALVGSMVFGKLDSEGAMGIVGGIVVIYPLVRLLSHISAEYWIGFGVVVALGIAIAVFFHFRRSRPQLIGALELVVGFAALALGVRGFLALHGVEAILAGVVGLVVGALECSKGLHKLIDARAPVATSPAPAAGTAAPAPAAKPKRRKAKPKPEPGPPAGPDET